MSGNVSPSYQIRGLSGGRGDIGERAAARRLRLSGGWSAY
jgi:hypothetical protein